MKKIILRVVVPVIAIGLVGAGIVNWCWNHRDTAETRREARKAVSKELRDMPDADVLPYLKDLRDMGLDITTKRDASRPNVFIYQLQEA